MRSAIARAIRDGDLAAAMPVLERYRDAHPDDANDSARYLADHAPVLFATLGDALTSEDTRELRVATKSFAVEILAGAVISIGTIIAATFAGGDARAKKPQPVLTEPLCVGEIETTVGHGSARKVARISSLRRCEEKR
ncbi:MAG: hypothetical protein M4D80_23295 [Myxococcota bacterium]|nr:hypothetical protein [Myxococcota bacterium]